MKERSPEQLKRQRENSRRCDVPREARLSFLDVDQVLGEYSDWTDKTTWPRRSSGDEVHAAAGGQTPPDQKDGPVGRFCRAFRVGEAIAKFELPYVHGSTEGRWTYALGSVAEGAIEYDDGLKFHSHHDTDPARGQNNAFDLVRLHRFGHLDAASSVATPVADLASYRAMCGLVSGLAECSDIRAGDEFEDLGPLPAVTDADPFEEKGKPDRFPFVKPGVILAKKNPVWRIKRLYPQNGIAEVLGNSGDGKSFFIFDTFCCIARGVKWRDRAVEQCGVAYIWAEGRARERILAYETKHKIKLDDFNFHILEAAPNLFKVEDARAVIKAILPLGVRVVAVDTLQATSNGANENSSDMSTYLANCNLIAKAMDGLVVISHHLGKNSDLGSRGFSGLKGAADAEITIFREEEARQAKISKMKDGGGEGELHPFKLEEIELGIDDDGDKITSCVIIHTNETLQKGAQGRKARPKGLPAQVLEMLRVMAPNGSTCNIEDLVEGIKKTLAPTGGARDLRRQNILCAINRSLIPQGHMYMHGEDRVSLTNIVSREEPSWLE